MKYILREKDHFFNDIRKLNINKMMHFIPISDFREKIKLIFIAKTCCINYKTNILFLILCWENKN
jgi:hypothetical protein